MEKKASTKKLLISILVVFVTGLYTGVSLPIEEKWSLPIMCIGTIIAVANMFVDDDQQNQQQ